MNIKYKRYFNTLQISDDQAVITKTSQNTQKLLDEIQWYLKIPDELTKYIPVIRESSQNPNNPFVTMDYYKFSLLADLYVTNELSLSEWEDLINVLLRVQKEMSNFKQRLNKEERKKRSKYMYVKKTLDRLSRLYTNSNFKSYFKEPFKINSKTYYPLDFYIKSIDEVCERILLSDVPEFRVIHGDYILSNILFDQQTKEVKLIDPRGDFGEQSIYGDPRYEYAKLIHSLEGYYELIINDLFKVSRPKSEITYEILTSKKQRDITKLSQDSLSTIKGIKRDEIELIESLLFLSMVPLHQDSPLRQIVMLAQGVEKFHKFVQK